VDADTAVAVDPDASSASPGIVVAGLVAPILAGGRSRWARPLTARWSSVPRPTSTPPPSSEEDPDVPGSARCPIAGRRFLVAPRFDPFVVEPGEQVRHRAAADPNAVDSLDRSARPGGLVR
jgi:hypothetical protein